MCWSFLVPDLFITTFVNDLVLRQVTIKLLFPIFIPNVKDILELVIQLGLLIILKIIDAICGLRVDEQAETGGLDLAEHGEVGYDL